MRYILAILGALALSATFASASTVDFHFGSATPHYTDKISKTVGDLTLDVTGYRCSSSGCYQTGKMVEWGTGIGIYANKKDSHQVDGYYKDEVLKLTFNKTVKLDHVSFTYYTANDDFNLYTWDGSSWVSNGQKDACEANCGNAHTVHSYAFAGDYVSNMFLVAAKGNDDDWKFKGVSVSPIPLPAAGWLLLGGLGGLAALKRRKMS